MWLSSFFCIKAEFFFSAEFIRSWSVSAGYERSNYVKSGLINSFLVIIAAFRSFLYQYIINSKIIFVPITTQVIIGWNVSWVLFCLYSLCLGYNSYHNATVLNINWNKSIAHLNCVILNLCVLSKPKSHRTNKPKNSSKS